MNINYYTKLSFLTAVLSGFLVTSLACANVLTAPPEGFTKLLHVDSHGGRVIRPNHFDLTQTNADWKYDKNDTKISYIPLYKRYGCYKVQLKNLKESKRFHSFVGSKDYVTLKANRQYLVSALIKTDFPRKKWEVNLVPRYHTTSGWGAGPLRMLGVPAMTKGPDGWQRVEWKITVPNDPRIDHTKAGASILIYGARGEKQPFNFYIADFAFIELPAKKLKYPGRGKGVTFPGSAGNLPMKIVSALQKGSHIIVKTTGAKYNFNTNNNTITASQRIGKKRKLAKWNSSLSLSNLRIDKKNDDVCVLTNNQMTIGVQCDGLLVISPKYALVMKLTNLLGGKFNRYARHYLLSEDDFGGITVDPYIPAGSGKKPHSKLLTKGLSFANYYKDALKTSHDYANFQDLGSAKPGWQARWTTQPGELFCTSVFPPRPYPWKQSFTWGWISAHRSTPLSSYKPQPFGHVWRLWNMGIRVWGQSWSYKFPAYNASRLKKVVKAIHGIGDRAMIYMSAFWMPNRTAKSYINAVRKAKQKFNIDGIYSDGLPSANWMLAYKEMRMLRQLFPSGDVAVHNSDPQSRWTVAQFMPFLYTYATLTYMGEGVPSKQGSKWEYPRYVTSQFRKSNSLGDTIPNNWHKPNGKRMAYAESSLVDLVYNGRDYIGSKGLESGFKKYLTILPKLYQLWKKKGDNPYFYDRYYLPEAQKLTGYKIGRAGMPIVSRKLIQSKAYIGLKTLTPDATIYYTTDGSIPTEDSTKYTKPFLIPAESTIKAKTFAQGLEPSVTAEISHSK